MNRIQALAPVLVALLVVAGARPVPASRVVQPSSAAAADTALAARVDSLMAEFEGEDSPGAVVGVIRGGEVAFARGYGMADLTHGIPITPETKFNLGSGAKQFMALAFALLAERGELSLDDPVADHLPDWPEFEQTVTLRHLLTHTSGYREAYGTLILAGRIPGRDFLAREEALEVVRRQPELEFPAGSDWKYNSTAWVILAEIAERVTGQPMAEWMEENVFAPLGMDDTAIESHVGQVIPRAAYSYTQAEDGGHRMEWSNRAIFGAAEVYTTVGDLAKWFRNFRTGEVGGPRVRERMREPFVLTTGDTTDYALGLSVGEHRGLRRISHGGSHAGYRAQLSYYPDLDAGVVVMSNFDEVRAGGVANDVAGFAFAEHMEPEEEPGSETTAGAEAAGEAVAVDSAVLASYAGQYRSEDGDVFPIEREDGNLEVDGQVVLVPRSDSVFDARGMAATVTFHRAGDGTVTGATLQGPGQSRALRRVEPWEPTADELEAYTGRYYSPELETIYTFRVDDEGRLVSRHRWHGTFRYTPLERDEFEGDPQGPRIRFDRNEVGVITGFYASVGRTEGVWFQRR